MNPPIGSNPSFTPPPEKPPDPKGFDWRPLFMPDVWEALGKGARAAASNGNIESLIRVMGAAKAAIELEFLMAKPAGKKA